MQPGCVEVGTLLDREPDIRGGPPKIAGTGITVSRVVSLYRAGLSPEEIELGADSCGTGLFPCERDRVGGRWGVAGRRAAREGIMREAAPEGAQGKWLGENRVVIEAKIPRVRALRIAMLMANGE